MGDNRLWRVVLEDGTVHGVVTRETENGLVVRRADGLGHNVVMVSASYAREGITRLCSRHDWPVVEIVAPDERSRAQIEAHLNAMREDYKRLLAATHAYLTASHRESGEATARAVLVEESGWSTCPCEGCAIGGEREAEGAQ
jgi:hypothetical protein